MTTPPLVGQVALGTARISLEPGRDRAVDLAMIRAAADAGIRVFDAARVYAPPSNPLYSEQLLAEALTARDDVLIGTKGGHFRIADDFLVDNSPERLRADVTASLGALGVERLSLYYLHRTDDLAVPLRESVGALAELRSAGLIERIGLSNVAADQLDEAQRITTIEAVQNFHSAAGRESADVLARCERLGIPFFAYSPLRAQASLGQLLPRLAMLATERGCSLARLAQRALLASSPVLSVVTGASRTSTVLDSARAMLEPWDTALEAAYRNDLRRGAQ